MSLLLMYSPKIKYHAAAIVADDIHSQTPLSPSLEPVLSILLLLVANPSFYFRPDSLSFFYGQVVLK